MIEVQLLQKRRDEVVEQVLGAKVKPIFDTYPTLQNIRIANTNSYNDERYTFAWHRDPGDNYVSYYILINDGIDIYNIDDQEALDPALGQAYADVLLIFESAYWQEWEKTLAGFVEVYFFRKDDRVGVQVFWEE